MAKQNQTPTPVRRDVAAAKSVVHLPAVRLQLVMLRTIFLWGGLLASNLLALDPGLVSGLLGSGLDHSNDINTMLGLLTPFLFVVAIGSPAAVWSILGGRVIYGFGGLSRDATHSHRNRSLVLTTCTVAMIPQCLLGAFCGSGGVALFTGISIAVSLAIAKHRGTSVGRELTNSLTEEAASRRSET